MTGAVTRPLASVPAGSTLPGDSATPALRDITNTRTASVRTHQVQLGCLSLCLSGCGCDNIGSNRLSCSDTGICDCQSNFIGDKCSQCAPERFNYPLCEECNCNPSGVTEDFFELGGCDVVPAGTLCTCKEKVTGRICDICKPLYWNLQNYNPEGCQGKK